MFDSCRGRHLFVSRAPNHAGREFILLTVRSARLRSACAGGTKITTSARTTAEPISRVFIELESNQAFRSTLSDGEFGLAESYGSVGKTAEARTLMQKVIARVSETGSSRKLAPEEESLRASASARLNEWK